MDLRLLALTVHLVGVALWVGSLVSLAALLAANATADARQTLGKVVARVADTGAGLAILGGLWQLSFAAGEYMRQPWMHAKLTLVVVLLGLHGFLRVRVKRGTPLPAVVLPALVVVAACIVGVVVFKPWAR